MIKFDQQMLDNPRALRNAFGCYMTGVTVVTTHDDNQKPLGFTANSFASVSLTPPLVLVCLANTSSNYDTFAHTRKFGINVLSEAQIEISNTFARPAKNRFMHVNWEKGPYGSPILDGVSAWFDCAMNKTIDAGDHLILIGAVKAFDYTVAPGLGYARGAYVTPAREAEALSKHSNLEVSALIERDGKVLLLNHEDGQLTLPTTRYVSNGATHALTRLIAETGVKAEPGFIYSVYQDEARQCQHISFLCQAEEGTPNKGVFMVLKEKTLMNIHDSAMATMLKRFALESRMGNFGVYYGNEMRGKVKPITIDNKGIMGNK